MSGATVNIHDSGTFVIFVNARIDGKPARRIQAKIDFGYGIRRLVGFPMRHPDDPSLSVELLPIPHIEIMHLRNSDAVPGAYEFTQEVQLRTVNASGNIDSV